MLAARRSLIQAKVAPVPSSFAWWDASQITGQGDNTTLATFPDFSGNGRPLTCSGLTYYKTTGAKLVNGLPAVWWNGGVANNGHATLTFAQPFTIAFVFQSNSAANQSLLSDNVADFLVSLNIAAGQYRYGAGTNVTPSQSTDTNLHSLIVVFNGASSTWTLDGITSSPSNAGGAGSANRLVYIGYNGNSGTNPFSGPIPETSIWASAFTAGQISEEYHYLKAKWGTP
jgi:hypothetical protein